MFLPVRGWGFHLPELYFTYYISLFFYQCAVDDFIRLSSLTHLVFPDFSTIYQCAVVDFMYLSSLSHLIFPDVSVSARLWISYAWALLLILHFLMFLPVCRCEFHVPDLSFSSYISWFFYQCAIETLFLYRCAVSKFHYLSSLLKHFLRFSTCA